MLGGQSANCGISFAAIHSITATTYTIGGMITGLTTSGLVLSNNAGDDLTVVGGAITFTFAITVSAYAVTVKTQPTPFTCTVTGASGTATANVTNIAISCVVPFLIGGSIQKVLSLTGAVTVLAGPANGVTTLGDLDGTGTAARFNSPFGITTDGTSLYVTEQGNNKIRRIQ